MSLTKEAYLLNFFDNSKYDAEHNVTRDETYNTPDYKRSAFYSGNRNDVNFYQIDHRNMVLPITQKPDFLNTISSRDGMKKTLNKFNPPHNVEQVYGVYITEEFIFQRGIFIDTDVIIDYYNNTDYIDHTDITINQIRADIERAKVIGRNRTSYTNLSFRVTTFIPEQEILDNGQLYVPNLDIVIAKSGIGTSTLHPRSKKYKQLLASEEAVRNTDGNTTISISLIDNVNYTNKPYYMKVGNEAIAVKSIKRTNEMSGCTITHVSNGSVVDSCYVTPSEYKDKGIYNDKESCLANGDNAGYLAIKKLELEQESIQLSYTKLEEDKKATISKYEHELAKIQMSYDAMKSDSEAKDKRAKADIDKLTLELDKIAEERKMLEYKSNTASTMHDKDILVHENELKMLKLKHDNEMDKLTSSKDKIASELELQRVKYEHDINVLLVAKDKLQADLKLSVTKHMNDMTALSNTKDKLTLELELQNSKYENDMNLLKEESNKRVEEVRVAKRKLTTELELLTAKAEQSKVEYKRKIIDAVVSTYINIYSQLLNVKQSRIKQMLEQTKLYNDIHHSNVKHGHEINKIVIDNSSKAINGVIGIAKQLIK